MLITEIILGHFLEPKQRKNIDLQHWLFILTSRSLYWLKLYLTLNQSNYTKNTHFDNILCIHLLSNLKLFPISCSVTYFVAESKIYLGSFMFPNRTQQLIFYQNNFFYIFSLIFKTGQCVFIQSLLIYFFEVDNI